MYYTGLNTLGCFPIALEALRPLCVTATKALTEAHQHDVGLALTTLGSDSDLLLHNS